MSESIVIVGTAMPAGTSGRNIARAAALATKAGHV